MKTKMTPNDLRVLKEKHQQENNVALTDIFFETMNNQRSDLQKSKVSVKQDVDTVTFIVTSEEDFTNELISFSQALKKAFGVTKPNVRVDTQTQSVILHHSSSELIEKLNLNSLRAEILETVAREEKLKKHGGPRLYSS